MPHFISPIKKKQNNLEVKSGSICDSLVTWKNKDSLLPNAANITWHSLTVGDLIFYHKGSRRASASERILAELGTLQGPGPTGALMAARVSGMLFTEDSLFLPASLE